MPDVLWFMLPVAAGLMVLAALVSKPERRGPHAADVFLMFFVLPLLLIAAVNLLGGWERWTAWVVSAASWALFLWLFNGRPWRDRSRF